MNQSSRMILKGSILLELLMRGHMAKRGFRWIHGAGIGWVMAGGGGHAFFCWDIKPTLIIG